MSKKDVGTTVPFTLRFAFPVASSVGEQRTPGFRLRLPPKPRWLVHAPHTWSTFRHVKQGHKCKHAHYTPDPHSSPIIHRSRHTGVHHHEHSGLYPITLSDAAVQTTERCRQHGSQLKITTTPEQDGRTVGKQL